jgi:membrane associated rhomboid family serine protease
MKFWATALLAALILIPYFQLSGGLLYLSDSVLNGLSFSSNPQPQNYLTHLFAHVGIQHLLGNLVPLLIFGLVLESVLAGVDVLLIFLASGVLSSILFTLLNPGVILVGASTGVAGLMAAATALKPKKSLVLLVLVPVLLLVLVPFSEFLSTQQLQGLEQQKTLLSAEIPKLVAEQKFEEAAKANETLATVEIKLSQTEEGVVREKTTRTDLFVHLFGAVFGLAYVFALRRKKMREGVLEFRDIGETLYSFKPSGGGKKKN